MAQIELTYTDNDATLIVKLPAVIPLRFTTKGIAFSSDGSSSVPDGVYPRIPMALMKAHRTNKTLGARQFRFQMPSKPASDSQSSQPGGIIIVSFEGANKTALPFIDVITLASDEDTIAMIKTAIEAFSLVELEKR
jgi:hypothetical protein